MARPKPQLRPFRTDQVRSERIAVVFLIKQVLGACYAMENIRGGETNEISW